MTVLAFLAVVVAVLFAVSASKAGVKRSEQGDGILGGVCAGLAKHWDVPANALRILLIASVLALGVGVAAYIIMWIILPSE